jgi:hypothetical protein
MQQFDFGEMPLQRCCEGLRQHGDAVLGALSVAHGHLTIGKIDLLDAQADTLHQAQANTVEQTCHERGGGRL